MVGLTSNWRYRDLMGKSCLELPCTVGFLAQGSLKDYTTGTSSSCWLNYITTCHAWRTSLVLLPSPTRRMKCSMSLVAYRDPSESPVADKDPSKSPPSVKGKGFKSRARYPPPPPPNKKRPKQKKPPQKLSYETTESETDAAVQEEMDRQIFKVKKTSVEKPIDQVKFHHFIRHMETKRRKNLSYVHCWTTTSKQSRYKKKRNMWRKFYLVLFPN